MTALPSRARARLDVHPNTPAPYVVSVAFRDLGDALDFARRLDPAGARIQAASTRTKLTQLVVRLAHQRIAAVNLVRAVRSVNAAMIEPLPVAELDALTEAVVRRHLERAAARRGARA